MSVATLTFTGLLNGVARSLGMAPTDASAEEKAAHAQFLTEATDYAWYWAEDGWPEIQRSVARTAASSVISMARDVGGSIDPIGQVLGVYENNPFTSRNPGPLPFGISSDGIVVNEDVGATAAVYVRFLDPAPLYTSVAWVTATAYVVGDVVYQDDRCYLCVVANTSTTFSTDLGDGEWVEQVVPQFLAEAIKAGALAALRESDGETARRQAMEAVLDRKLAGIIRRYEKLTSGGLRLIGSGVV